MVIDLGKCVGCGACALACKQANATPPGVWWNTVHQYETGTYPSARLRFLPAACQQCEVPACLKACPTKATFQRPDGIVAIDVEVCVGCGYCAWSCPYGARTLNESEPQPYHPIGNTCLGSLYSILPVNQQHRYGHSLFLSIHPLFQAARLFRRQ
jgi:Fe-S-cluster-containing dehydrogenase component